MPKPSDIRYFLRDHIAYISTQPRTKAVRVAAAKFALLMFDPRGAILESVQLAEYQHRTAVAEPRYAVYRWELFKIAAYFHSKHPGTGADRAWQTILNAVNASRSHLSMPSRSIS